MSRTQHVRGILGGCREPLPTGPQLLDGLGRSSPDSHAGWRRPKEQPDSSGFRVPAQGQTAWAWRESRAGLGGLHRVAQGWAQSLSLTCYSALGRSLSCVGKGGLVGLLACSGC